MSWGIVAGAAASVVGGVLSAKGSKDAADKAAEGSQAEIEFNRESRDLIMEQQRPYREAGYTALDALMKLTGLKEGAKSTAINPETGYPYENDGSFISSQDAGTTAASLGPAFTRNGGMDDVAPLAGRPVMGGRQSAYKLMYNGGPAYRDTIYNISELAPENVYSGGAMKRYQSPTTIGDMDGYVEPNIEGRGLGGFLKKLANPFSSESVSGAIAHFDPIGAAVYYNKNKATQPGVTGGSPSNLPSVKDDTSGAGDYSFQTDPGYQFRFEEGMRALDRGAAARGGLLSGGYGRKAIRYGQGFASNEYTNVYNRIANIAGLGQTANAASGNAALYAGANMGSAASAQGINSAYGAIGQSNAWGNAINQFAQLPWGDIFNKQQPVSARPPY